ncbi:MAG TPA: hypothetical protein ENI88_11985 [Desulfobulbus sp.]|nr:hypothetical protein [Desulfobulbus sp.]
MSVHAYVYPSAPRQTENKISVIFNRKPRTQNSKLRTQNSKLRTQNSELRTQHTYIPRYAFCTSSLDSRVEALSWRVILPVSST